MPYMFSQVAADVPCTLLHFVGGKLIDVANGRIIQPGNHVFHGNPMPPTVYRVQLVRVLRGCDDLLPPYRPPGADEDDVMTLSACVSWPLLWPKSQIRLGAGDTTPQTTPPVVSAPSHGKTAAMLPPSADPDMHMAQDPATTVHLPTSVSTSTNMGTMTNSWGLLLKNPTLQKTI